jgi:hypothetical protein
MRHDARRWRPATITRESAVLGTEMGLAIVGGGAILAGAQLGGFALLAARARVPRRQLDDAASQLSRASPCFARRSYRGRR